MKNKEIRERLMADGIRHWQLAEEIGINEATLCVWLRRELEGERLERVQAALKKLTGEGTK